MTAPDVPLPEGAVCPTCSKPLKRVTYPGGYLNEEQWDANRAGDWVCEACPDNGRAANKKFSYFWDSEVARLNAPASLPQCDICQDTGLTPGWTPSYNNPDNSGGHQEAEPCDCPAGHKRFPDMFKITEAPASLTPGVGERLSPDQEVMAPLKGAFDLMAPAVVTEGETPRCDAQPCDHFINCEPQTVPRAFARQLERELTAANAERVKANATIERLSRVLDTNFLREVQTLLRTRTFHDPKCLKWQQAVASCSCDQERICCQFERLISDLAALTAGSENS